MSGQTAGQTANQLTDKIRPFYAHSQDEATSPEAGSFTCIIQYIAYMHTYIQTIMYT